MVSVSSMLAAISAAVGSAHAASLTALPSFDVPAFDYPTLAQGDAPQRLLQALQTDGIVALKNVPNYANLRERYLREAAQCAAVNADLNHDTFITRKLFGDGTKRTTISTDAGRELRGSAAATEATCPGFRELYEEFSQTIEHAVNTFGATLDKTSFTASDGQKTISTRQLVSDAVRLDHFHAYEAAPSVNDETHRQLEMSLPLHEDHGLFIAMSAPKYFEVDGRRLVERELSPDASGLILQTSTGQRVRPVLNADEVVIMMGTGASRWLQTSHPLRPVLHGMKMPEAMIESTNSGRRSLRAWFGKMTLLPSYQRMLATSSAFQAHLNATTRQLLTQVDSDLKTVGCATGRHLAASDEKCTLRQCTLKAGATAPEEPCGTICNRKGHSDDDATNCAAKCTCTDVAGSAQICWMLCVANFPTSECALDKQTCSGQKVVCSSPTPTTATPSTTSPPVTTSPPPVSTTKAPTNAPTSASPAGSPSSTPAPGSTTASPSSTTSKPSTATTKPGANPSSTSPETPSSTSANSGDSSGESSRPSSSTTTSSSTTGTSGSGSKGSISGEPQVGSNSGTKAPTSTTTAPTSTPKSSASTLLAASTVVVAASVASVLL